MKITGLPARAAVALTDIMAIVDAAGGVPATWKATFAQVRAALMPIALAVDVTGLLPLANQAAPTGTGVVKNVAGAWGAAAALIVDADVAAGAAVAVAKLAPGANTQVLTTSGGVTVWAAASGGGAVPTGTGFYHITAGVMDAASKKVDLTLAADITVPATANAPIISNGTALAQPTGILMGTNFVSIGAIPCNVGGLRLASLTEIGCRNAGNTADLCAMVADGSDNLLIGTASPIGTRAYAAVYLNPSSNLLLGCAGATYVSIANTGVTINNTVLMGGPIVGNGSSSPHGVHGHISFSAAGAVASISVTAAQYAMSSQVFTGARTAIADMVYPAATDATAYYKWVQNSTTGGFSITIKNGALPTGVVLSGGGTPHLCLFNSAGVTQLI